jgi:hypothetical protein
MGGAKCLAGSEDGANLPQPRRAPASFVWAQTATKPPGAVVKISLVYSTGRTETGVTRILEGERRSLVVMCLWRQSPAATLAMVRHQLTDEEAAELAAALDLDRHEATLPSRPVTNSGP